MKKLDMFFISILMGLFLIIGNLLSVYAQETADEEFTLEEITVTAEKREENLQKTALAITAITGDLIGNMQKNTLDEALRNTPSLQIQGLVHGGSFFIRGIGNTEGTPSVSTNIDGVYQASNDAVSQSVYDIERIEVIRGPSGTMAGRNATGGAINVVTSAIVDKFEASGSVQIGNYDEARTEGMVNVPVNNKLAFRAAFQTEKHDGYLSNGNVNADSFATRFKVRFQPTDDLKLVATFEYKTDGAVPGTVPAPLSSHSDDPWYSDHLQGIYDLKARTYTLNIDWNMGWGNLTFIPTYSHDSNYENVEMVMGVTAQTGENRQLGGELRIASPADSVITWVGGIFYLKMWSPTSPSLIFSRITNEWMGGGAVLDPNTEVFNTIGGFPDQQIAGFGQVTYPITDRFRLTGGARTTRDIKKNRYYYTIEATGYQSEIYKYESDFGETTYKAGAEYDINDDSMIYTAVSTGYNTGMFQAGDPPTIVKPEELMAYTIGTKNRFMTNRIQINAEAFYYDYKNQQVQYPGINSSTGQFGMLRTNAARSKMNGGEIETSFLFTKGDRLDLNIAYLNAEYEKFVYSDVFGPKDYSGTQMPNSPKLSGTITYEHNWNMADAGQLSLQASVHYSGEYYTTFEKDFLESIQESFHRSDAYLAYYSPDGKWSARIYCKNIENEAQRIYATPANRIMISTPRTIGIRFAAKF